MGKKEADACLGRRYEDWIRRKGFGAAMERCGGGGGGVL